MTAAPHTSEIAQVRHDLRIEVGPTGMAGDGRGNWQPMVSAREVWTLLDALSAAEAVLDAMPCTQESGASGVCFHCHLAVAIQPAATIADEQS